MRTIRHKNASENVMQFQKCILDFSSNCYSRERSTSLKMFNRAALDIWARGARACGRSCSSFGLKRERGGRGRWKIEKWTMINRFLLGKCISNIRSSSNRSISPFHCFQREMLWLGRKKLSAAAKFKEKQWFSSFEIISLWSWEIIETKVPSQAQVRREK